MAWTYAADMTQGRDRVRLLTGDTDSGDPQLADEEIAAFLPLTGALAQVNDWFAAAACCDTLAARYARQVDVSIGLTRTALSARLGAYRQKAADLRQRALLVGGATPYAGGISVADEQAAVTDPDRVAPAVTMMTGDDTGGTALSSSGWGEWP